MSDGNMYGRLLPKQEQWIKSRNSEYDSRKKQTILTP